MAGYSLCVLAACLVASHCLSVQMTGTPTNIMLGITSSIKLNCQFTTDPSISNVVNIIISFKGATQTTWTQLASINGFTQTATQKTQFKGVVTGHFNKSSNNYNLNVEYYFPDTAQAGDYKCTVTSMNSHGHVGTNDKTLSIASQVPGMSEVVQGLKDLQAKELNCTQEINKRRAIRLAMPARINKLSKISPIEAAGVFEGHLYFVKKPDNRYLDMNTAQTFCQNQGGYLAEINTDREFKFVSNILSTPTAKDFTDVFIGLSDEGHLGTYANMKNVNDPIYTKFSTASVAKGSSPRWVAFQYDAFPMEWLMRAYYYTSSFSNSEFYYLCEIP